MEKFDLENFPTSSSAKKMLGYVSDGFYNKSYVGKWIFQVMGIEYDKALDIVMELPEQFFPETATWGLMYHEIKWGLPVRQNLTYEQRRRFIYQKRDFRAPMTPYRMERYLEDATGFEVHITDANDPGEYGFIPPHPNTFKAYFLGEGTLDVNEAFAILSRLKQSHTTYVLNDRVEMESDNRNLEQMMFKRFMMHTRVYFWNQFYFDGTWKFDGSKQFNASRGRMEVKCNMHMKVDANTEYIGDVMVIVKRNPHFFDGSCKFDGSVMANAVYREEVIE